MILTALLPPYKKLIKETNNFRNLFLKGFKKRTFVKTERCSRSTESADFQ